MSFGLFLQMIGVNIEIPGSENIALWFRSLLSGQDASSKAVPASNLVGQLFPKK
jgi:hypothetical protein